MPVVELSHLSYAYPAAGESRVALDDLSLTINRGEVFGFLGPNGSGKSTLFRILSTLISPPPGSVKMLGTDPAAGRSAIDFIRARIGVVFQSPSLDKQLTAEENLLHQGHLYGLRGADLRGRVAEALATFGLTDRAGERVARFSGGMRRRVEVAKGLLHRPQLLLMDEPSTGLDPAARIDLWQAMERISRADGVTVLLTTHLMEEADKCDRLAVLAHGRLLACDRPADLKSRIGGDVITITTAEPARVAAALREKLGVEAVVVEQSVRLEREHGHAFIPHLIEALPGLVDAVSVGRPTLEDVFIQLTGSRFATTLDEPATVEKPRLPRKEQDNPQIKIH